MSEEEVFLNGFVSFLAMIAGRGLFFLFPFVWRGGGCAQLNNL